MNFLQSFHKVIKNVTDVTAELLLICLKGGYLGEEGTGGTGGRGGREREGASAVTSVTSVTKASFRGVRMLPQNYFCGNTR